jgi:hypothetical protein
LSVKDHSILEALSVSLDEKDDRHSRTVGVASGAKHFNEAQHFSALHGGKAKRVAQIIDTRLHQRMEQALVEWTDGSTAWIGIQDLSSKAQDHVRMRMQDELGVLEEEDEKSESERKKRKRRRPVSQAAKAQSRDERKKRQKKKEAEELDAKISMPTCVCLSCSQMCRRDVGQC